LLILLFWTHFLTGQCWVQYRVCVQ